MKKVVGICLGIVLLVFVSCSNKVESIDKLLKNANFTEMDYKTIVQPNNNLGFTLLQNIESDENHNKFISPTSLFMALSMVFHGADSETKEEIANVLHINNMKDEKILSANASLLNKLLQDSETIDLAIANSMWLNDMLEFQDEFAKNNTDYFTAEIEEIDIQDVDAADRINKWVEDATNKKIDSIIEPPLSANFVALLINALYFKGDWKYEFNEDFTSEKPFYLPDGTTKDVPLMVLEEKLYYFENVEFQAVKLPYGDEEMQMQVFLPREGYSLDELVNTLDTKKWNQWQNQYKKIEGTIELPKFEMEYEKKLNDTLENMGMETAFNPDKANFPHIIKESAPLYIDEVKQKTFIEVNEKGTEAAAVTSVGITEMSAPIDVESFYMEVNRPFLFAITDEETGTILFLGAISDPQ